MKTPSYTVHRTIFWLCNLTVLVIVYAGILPTVGSLLIPATWRGNLPWDFLITLGALVAVPTLFTWIGWTRLRDDPIQIIRLFCGVEIPLFLLCLVRLFLIRELTFATTQMLITVAICALAFGLEVRYGYIARDPAIALRQRNLVAGAQLVCHSLMLVIGLYAGILLLFYAAPLPGWLLSPLFNSPWMESFADLFSWNSLLLWLVFIAPLLLISLAWMGTSTVQHNFNLKAIRRFSLLTLLAIAVCLALPFWAVFPGLLLLFGLSALFVTLFAALTKHYIQSWHSIFNAFAAQYGRNWALAGSIAVVTTWVLVFLALQQQPQVEAFALLEKPPTSDRERQTLLDKSETIRKGLLNAYLFPYRYLSTNTEVEHIQMIYQQVFGLPESTAQMVQAVYNGLMSPFLYCGDRTDSDKAAKFYAEFFDTSIQTAERPAISHAMRLTWNQDEVKAGLLNINQKKVWLQKQHINVTSRGDWADVELHEVYENQTDAVQEVFYSFSLPESAVITGLWLGDETNEKRFSFSVSPRGAAQRTYNQQVRWERVRRPEDPALLEQVGPRHYRLRAYPILVQSSAIDRLTSQAPGSQFHLWLTYKVIHQDQGFALPQLAEKRNIFWTNQTQRFVNGKAVKQDGWLPPFVDVPSQSPMLHQVRLPGDDIINADLSLRVVAKPLSPQDYAFPQGKRFAVVLDESHSMKAHARQVRELFQWLKDNGFTDNELTNNDADLYLTTIGAVQPQRIDDLRQFEPANISFYGTIQPEDMLQQFAKLQGNTSYDAVILVTDEGSYELSDDQTTIPALSAPLWMVHLGGMPSGYEDALLKAMQDSGGGVATNLPEVLQRIATEAKLGSSAISVVDGYAWFWEQVTPIETATSTKVTAASEQGAIAPQSGFEPLAARQLAVKLSKSLSQETKTNTLTQLEQIHHLAKTLNIVTPYSSMIVLVNDQQRDTLKRAEALSDRFSRQVETGEEQLTQPFNPLVSGVPEPEEWLLIGIGAIALCMIGIRQRFTLLSSDS